MRYLSILLLSVLGAAAQQRPADTLRIYAIDTEGGKATLYVAPNGESMLIDAGYGNDARDSKRIAAAASAAGVKQIDHLVITHYHADHAGGVAQLIAAIPVRAVYDHGDTVEPGSDEALYSRYRTAIGKTPRTILKPGDRIRMKQLDVMIVSSGGVGIKKSLGGAGQPNPLCAAYKPLTQDRGENAKSVAMMITFGKLRISDLGDLFWNQEADLACPNNLLGHVDLYMTTHHGTKTSGAPQIVQALHPKVAIMNNGAKKGGQPEAWETIHTSPGLIEMWQLHFSNEGGAEHNVAEQFIANPKEDCTGERIDVIATRDGTFTVTNTRNGVSKTYRN